MRSLHDLVDSLVVSSHKLQIRDNSVRALSLPPSMAGEYVWPNLKAVDISAKAHIFLVQAAGAIGKSAAAAALAGRMRWPLVDAAKAQVGSYSLSGLLHDAFGFDSGYVVEVASGRAGIIVDALDEAHLRAGTTNFLAFLDNVGKIAGDSHDNVSVVLYSRPDTAEIVKLYLRSRVFPFRPRQLTILHTSRRVAM